MVVRNVQKKGVSDCNQSLPPPSFSNLTKIANG